MCDSVRSWNKKELNLYKCKCIHYTICWYLLHWKFLKGCWPLSLLKLFLWGWHLPFFQLQITCNFQSSLASASYQSNYCWMLTPANIDTKDRRCQHPLIWTQNKWMLAPYTYNPTSYSLFWTLLLFYKIFITEIL